MLLYEFATFYFKFFLVEFNFIGLDWENENEKALTNETASGACVMAGNGTSILDALIGVGRCSTYCFL